MTIYKHIMDIEGSYKVIPYEYTQVGSLILLGEPQETLERTIHNSTVTKLILVNDEYIIYYSFAEVLQDKEMKKIISSILKIHMSEYERCQEGIFKLEQSRDKAHKEYNRIHKKWINIISSED